ncbi:phytanoyl-CoA dioxygenase family protein [Roseococcus pinisoli]|uniref:Phytanoyl-CoA dioxygenase family protein n=1 Tax=Roseococcus pinisoli TaxID=2835040 RepID=A0ABS5Q6Z2_9PROT|nr:phytanoyl-CoA dioxygenase family protein [Roseococcus pinisoli]MBS7809397.1 phytanoyl-CoA dioxygenase family protein [Roseococcus pinisoli]
MAAVLDREAFARDGFSVIRRAVPEPLLSALDGAVRRVQATVSGLPPSLLARLTFERDLPEAHRGGIAAAEVGDAIFILGDPVAFDDVFWSVLREPAIGGAVRDAVGVPEVVAHFMNVTIKHPRFGRRIGWHRDFPNRYACPATPSFVRVMLCLDGMTEEGGATTFLPGSHLIDDAAARAHPRPEEAQLHEAVPVLCDPGDLVVIHPKVLHGGGMNASGRARRNIVLQAGDAAALLDVVPEQEEVAGHRLGPA